MPSLGNAFRYSARLFLLALLAAACSDPNARSLQNPSTGTHAAGWADPASHGAIAKKAPTSASGFASCQQCHGIDFSGGIANASCFPCHGVNAPHPPAPWRDAARTHSLTDRGNAPVCGLCHLGGANSTVHPSSSAPAGAAPDCFNATLCHAQAGHPAGWSAPDQHGVAAEQDFDACKACHGADYRGGAVGIGCYDCHGGPGITHPAPAWVVFDHKTAAVADSTLCRKCHGADYLGGGSHRACNSCHLENETKVHVVSWYPDVRNNHRPYVLANGVPRCANVYCHGADLTGVSQSGPACSTCHAWPITTCTSCHGTPPSGTAYPDIAGAHSVHGTTLNPAITCSTCHQGAGYGTNLHMNGAADVLFDPAYQAKAGAASFNRAAATCANIACHGASRTQTASQAGSNPPQSTPGQTPAWGAGTINVNTQCTLCHVLGAASGSPENNSYFSGQHYRHVYQQGKACTACHDTAKLAGLHFTSLTAPFTSASASQTLNSAINFNGATCSPSSGGLTGCHGSETW